VGAGVTLVTGKSARRSGLRRTLFALVTASVVFFIGKVLGPITNGWAGFCSLAPNAPEGPTSRPLRTVWVRAT
jgi:hypothetical protein